MIKNLARIAVLLTFVVLGMIFPLTVLKEETVTIHKTSPRVSNIEVSAAIGSVQPIKTEEPIYIFEEVIDPIEPEEEIVEIVDVREEYMDESYENDIFEEFVEEVYEESEDDWIYYGTCYITNYCNCDICCGEWAGGATASGAFPMAGRTVATQSLPFGTEVLIDGNVYVVEDRGYYDEMWFDIYRDSHEEALANGAYYTEIYIR